MHFNFENETDGLVQSYNIDIANVLEIPQSFTKPL